MTTEGENERLTDEVNRPSGENGMLQTQREVRGGKIISWI